MTKKDMDKLYTADEIAVDDREEKRNVGTISEREKLIAAKQILLGLAVLFVITIIAYLIRPVEGSVLLEICKTVFPPLATLIIAFYFKDRVNH